jgi:non-heme chloroperoxidase
MRLRRVLAVPAVLLLLVASASGLGIAFGTAEPPAHMRSISDPFKQVDFSGLPPLASVTSRDGTKLVYREYTGRDPARLVLLIHGSSGNNVGMHPLARAISAQGPTVWSLDIRGHGGSGRRGDIDYVGQLDDDMEDLVKAARATIADRKLTVLGFSAGGAYALHVGSHSKVAGQFERVVLLAPFLGTRSGTARKPDGDKNDENGNVWARPFLPRIVGLLVANTVCVHAFDGLPVIAFAIDPAHAKNLAATYSWRLLQDFGSARRDIEDELRHATHAPELWIGDQDEIFDPDAVRAKVLALRPDAKVTVVPGATHIGLTVNRDAVAAIAGTF